MGNILQASYIDVHEAARSGHIDEVRRWVDDGRPVDARDNTQKTPLHYAAQWGQEETLDFLIECEANVNAADFIEDTPLHFACYFGHANCARILILAGANVNAKDCYGNTPSQIFDDHVTEPVLDEIRFLVREVIRPSAQPEEAAVPSSVVTPVDGNVAPLVAGPSSTQRAKSGVAQATEAETVAAEAANPQPPGVAREEAHPLALAATSKIPAEVSSGVGGHPGLLHSVGNQQVVHQSMAKTDSRQTPAGSPLSRTSADPNDRLPPTAIRPPRLNLNLPWDEELGQAIQEGGLGNSSGAAGATNARTPGAGVGGRGATYPGPRLSPTTQMRPMIGNNKFRATSPTLSGRTYSIVDNSNGGTPTKGAGLKGASLAGTLLMYATRPGGKFDVFAAARDGQVSVLKQALTDGEKVDIMDESGMTALMWAARAGRLSTAKYLVSQGAILQRRHDDTGFSALHFAAYYCRSSVVRILVLAGADTRGTDNQGHAPGARFQPMSYLSYDGFQQRRLIGRFLSGDLKDGMDDKGKTMFPMNAPLEAYDEDHKPQYVRLGSNDNLVTSPDHESEEERDKTLKGGNARSGAHPPSPSRAYATMKTMNSGATDCSNAEGEVLSGSSNNGSPNPRTRKTSSAPKSGKQAQGGGSRIRYYLRRTSLGAPVPRKSSGDNTAADSNRRGSRSPRTRGAGGSIKYYLRRASVEGRASIQSVLGHGGGGDDGALGSSGRASTEENNRGDQQASAMYKAMIDAVAAAEAASDAGSDVNSTNVVEENTLDNVEAGRRHSRSRRDSLTRRDGRGGGSEGGKEAGGVAGSARRRLSARLVEGIEGGAKGLAAHFKWQRDGAPAAESHRSRASLGQSGSPDIGGVACDRSASSSPRRNCENTSVESSARLEPAAQRHSQQRRDASQDNNKATTPIAPLADDDTTELVTPLQERSCGTRGVAVASGERSRTDRRTRDKVLSGSSTRLPLTEEPELQQHRSGASCHKDSSNSRVSVEPSGDENCTESVSPLPSRKGYEGAVTSEHTMEYPPKRENQVEFSPGLQVVLEQQPEKQGGIHSRSSNNSNTTTSSVGSPSGKTGTGLAIQTQLDSREANRADDDTVLGHGPPSPVCGSIVVNVGSNGRVATRATSDDVRTRTTSALEEVNQNHLVREDTRPSATAATAGRDNRSIDSTTPLSAAMKSSQPLVEQGSTSPKLQATTSLETAQAVIFKDHMPFTPLKESKGSRDNSAADDGGALPLPRPSDGGLVKRAGASSPKGGVVATASAVATNRALIASDQEQVGQRDEERQMEERQEGAGVRHNGQGSAQSRGQRGSTNERPVLSAAPGNAFFASGGPQKLELHEEQSGARVSAAFLDKGVVRGEASPRDETNTNAAATSTANVATAEGADSRAPPGFATPLVVSTTKGEGNEKPLSERWGDYSSAPSSPGVGGSDSEGGGEDETLTPQKRRGGERSERKHRHRHKHRRHRDRKGKEKSSKSSSRRQNGVDDGSGGNGSIGSNRSTRSGSLSPLKRARPPSQVVPGGAAAIVSGGPSPSEVLSIVSGNGESDGGCRAAGEGKEDLSSPPQGSQPMSVGTRFDGGYSIANDEQRAKPMPLSTDEGVATVGDGGG